MRFGVVVFPGSNSEEDTVFVLREVLGQEAVYLWHDDEDLQGSEAVIVPGGFAYGDYLRSGAIARFSPIMEQVRIHAGEGKPVLGICNGMQILQEAGLLPGVMMRNAGLKYLSQFVHVRVERADTAFTSDCSQGQVLRLPISHNDGNFFASTEDLALLRSHRQVTFRYCDADGNVSPQANVNGSADSIAGVINDRGNVMALMPHPERAAERLLGSEDGRCIFRSLVESLQLAR